MINLIVILIPIVAADALFEKVNRFMEKASAVIIPVLLFLIGATLIVDAVWYFTRGEILINVG